MPTWWLQWAERIALALAEWWLRSRPGRAGDGAGLPPADRPAGPDVDVTARPPSPSDPGPPR
jgi:hypothetical protein